MEVHALFHCSPGHLLKTTLQDHQKRNLTFLLAQEGDIKALRRFATDPAVRRQPTNIAVAARVPETIKCERIIKSSFHFRSEYSWPSGNGCVLADEPGLGKSLSLIALLACSMQTAKTLAKGMSNLLRTDGATYGSIANVHPPSEAQKAIEFTPNQADDDDDDNAELDVDEIPVGDPTSFEPGNPNQIITATADDRHEDEVEGDEDEEHENQGDGDERDVKGVDGKNDPLIDREAFHSTLIVCPKSVLKNWLSEFAKHWAAGIAQSAEEQRYRKPKGAGRGKRPILIHTFYGKGRGIGLKSLQEYDVILTTYGVVTSELRREHSVLKLAEFHRVIWDEAHNLSNWQSEQYESCRKLAAFNTVLCTGTPYQNHSESIWSLARFLNIRYDLPDPVDTLSFQTAETASLSTDLQPLQWFLQAHATRTLKEDVIIQPGLLPLPPKTTYRVHLVFSAVQRPLYEQYDQRGWARANICNVIQVGHSSLFRGEDEEDVDQALSHVYSQRLSSTVRVLLSHSARLAALNKQLRDLQALERQHTAAGGDGVNNPFTKTVVFSHSTRLLKQAEYILRHLGISNIHLDGRLDVEDRQARIEQFGNDQNVKVILVSIDAASEGISLVAADRVILLDPTWNPTVEEQAIHRVTKPITVYHYYIDASIDEHVVEIQDRKIKEALQVFGDSREPEQPITLNWNCYQDADDGATHTQDDAICVSAA